MKRATSIPTDTATQDTAAPMIPPERNIEIVYVWRHEGTWRYKMEFIVNSYSHWCGR